MGPSAEQTQTVAFPDAPLGQLWAGDLCVDHLDDALSISVSLHWDGPTAPPALPSGRRLRVEVNDLDRLGGDRRQLLAAHTPPNATALVPLLAVIAAATGADLTIEAPVCPTALAGARRAIAVGQFAHGWSAVTLGATAGAAGPPHHGGDGLVFSLNLESLATLVELRGAQLAPTHLLAIDGSQPTATGGHRSGRSEAMAANATRLPLVRASTNAGELAISGMGSPTAEQAISAACALALAGVVGSVTLPTGRRAATDHSPDTTTLWSSAAVRLSPTTSRPSVSDAATLVATSPWALQWLQVCPSHGGDRNCGRCAPCQFTLTALWLAGVTDADLPGFDHAVDPAVIRALPPGDHRDHRGRHDYLDLIANLTGVAEGTAGEPATALRGERFLAAALAEAWAAHLERLEAWTAHLEFANAPTGTHALSA